MIFEQQAFFTKLILHNSKLAAQIYVYTINVAIFKEEKQKKSPLKGFCEV